MAYRDYFDEVQTPTGPAWVAKPGVDIPKEAWADPEVQAHLPKLIEVKGFGERVYPGPQLRREQFEYRPDPTTEGGPVKGLGDTALKAADLALERAGEIPLNLLQAFGETWAAALQRPVTYGASRLPVPWEKQVPGPMSWADTAKYGALVEALGGPRNVPGEWGPWDVARMAGEFGGDLGMIASLGMTVPAKIASKTKVLKEILRAAKAQKVPATEIRAINRELKELTKQLRKAKGGRMQQILGQPETALRFNPLYFGKKYGIDIPLVPMGPITKGLGAAGKVAAKAVPPPVTKLGKDIKSLVVSPGLRREDVWPDIEQMLRAKQAGRIEAEKMQTQMTARLIAIANKTGRSTEEVGQAVLRGQEAIGSIKKIQARLPKITKQLKSLQLRRSKPNLSAEIRKTNAKAQEKWERLSKKMKQLIKESDSLQKALSKRQFEIESLLPAEMNLVRLGSRVSRGTKAREIAEGIRTRELADESMSYIIHQMTPEARKIWTKEPGTWQQRWIDFYGKQATGIGKEPFLKARTMKGTIGEIEEWWAKVRPEGVEAPFLIQDPAALNALRLKLSIGAMADARMVKSLAARHAQPATQVVGPKLSLTEFLAGENIGEFLGTKFPRDVPGIIQALNEAGVGDDPRLYFNQATRKVLGERGEEVFEGMGNVENLAVPKEIRTAIAGMHDAVSTSDHLRTLGQAISLYDGLSRSLAIGPWPAYHSRNVGSDIFMWVATDGIRDPRNITRGFNLVYKQRMGKLSRSEQALWDEGVKDRISRFSFGTEMQSMWKPQTGQGKIGRGLEALSGEETALSRALKEKGLIGSVLEVQRFMEQAVRYGHYMDLRGSGYIGRGAKRQLGIGRRMTGIQAGRRVLRAHFDYDPAIMTPIERKWARPTTMFYCVPDDCEILTDQGWQFYNELRPGTTQVLVYEHEKDFAQWDTLDEVAIFDYEGELIKIGADESKNGAFLCTPSHTWPILDDKNQRKKVEAFQLRHAHKIPTAPAQTIFPDKGITAREATAIGWILTDGSIGPGSAMRIYQKKEPFLSEIKALLGDDVGFRVGTNDVTVLWLRGDFRQRLFDLMPSKQAACSILPLLTKEAAEALWNAMYKADGVTKAKPDGSPAQPFFAQCKHQSVFDLFQIVSVMLGKTVHQRPRGGYIRTRMTRQIYSLNTEKYQGKVWCPCLNNRCWFMRRRGRVIATGNTFQRRNMEFWWKFIWDEPQRAAVITKAYNTKDREMRESLPWWAQNVSLNVPDGKGGIYHAETGWPGEDYSQWASRKSQGWFAKRQENLSRFLSSLSPTIGGVLELGAGKQFYSNRDIYTLNELPAGVAEHLPEFIKDAFHVRLETDKFGRQSWLADPALTYILRRIPGNRLISTMKQAEDDQWFQVLLGIKYTHFSAEQLASEEARRPYLDFKQEMRERNVKPGLTEDGMMLGIMERAYRPLNQMEQLRRIGEESR